MLSDLHLPVKARKHPDPADRERIVEAKLKTRADVNGWDDVLAVAVTGDLVAESGSPAELEAASAYLKGFRAPVWAVLGNHEFGYRGEADAAGRLLPLPAAQRPAKREAALAYFGLASPGYAHSVNGWRLVFLQPTSDSFPAGLSEASLAWLDAELGRHAGEPAIIFFHAPLMGTLRAYKKDINTPRTTAQPEAALAAVLKNHPRARFWVSGHTHTSPREPSFADGAANLYAGQVVNLHNPGLERRKQWSRSLYLCRDRLVARTYNHTAGRWEAGL
ncbi:MAG: metallophosphoesterase, partial [Duodenibacillus sp.]|nr:metallophosphoesterase [Duodenibacillus sp.]